MGGLRRLSAIAGAVGLLGLAAACGANSVDDVAVDETTSSAVESVEEVTPGGDLRIGIEIKPTTFDPMPNGSASGAGEQYVFEALYDGLTAYSELDGSIEGRLAESFEPNDDFTKWTVKLREGVTFSDGEPFTAEAVVANFEFRAKAENCQCAEEYQRLTATAVDDLTVEIAIDGGDAHAPANAFLARMMSPKTLVAGYDRNTKPIGTGPFTLADREKLTFEKNENYWRTDDRGRSLPFVDTLTLVPISDPTVRLAALRKGEVDVMESYDGVTIASASDDDQLTVYPGPKTALTVGIANTSSAPLDNPDLRRAAALALDREALAASLVDGNAQPAYSFLVASSSDGMKGEFPRHDLAEAKKLVEKVKKETGQDSIELSLVCAKIPDSEATMPVVKNQLDAAGFTTSLRLLDIGTFAGVLLAQNSKDFSFACSRVNMGTDPSILETVLKTGAATNVAGYSNPEVDELFVQDRKTSDEKERQKIYQQISDIVIEDVPYLPLLADQNAFITTSAIAGVGTPNASFPTVVSTAVLSRTDR